MKLQHLIVIFLIIMVPISFILGVYINNQVDTIRTQADYNMILMNATYDAIKAFQLNTINNRYSSVSDSKIRDIEAEINTFYNSLGLSMQMNTDVLRQFTPAIVNTLYDGYYIYSKFANTKNDNEYEYGLRSYIYYSCRYRNTARNTDCVINYTLDNAITVYGIINGTYVTKTGFLIAPSNIENYNTEDIKTRLRNGNTAGINSLNYKGLNITTEYLQETLITISKDSLGNVTPTKGTYLYTFYNNRKVYRGSWNASKGRYNYFWYENFEVTPVSDSNTDTINYANATIGQNRSALDYYIQAYQFSKWMEDNLGFLTANDAIDEEGNPIEFDTNNTGAEPIFMFNNTTNDPEMSSSVFETHRRAIIKNRIETSLIAALANYNLNSVTGYEYILPKLKDVDWEKIYTEVCIITYMQGIPIGSKYYNNYCVISNNKNKEFISKSSIILLTEETVNGVKKYTYHKPNCIHLIENNASINIIGAYTNLQLARQKVDISGENSVYFMPQEAYNSEDNHVYPYLYCYDCIVNIADVYDLGQFIDGEIRDLDDNGGDSVRIIPATAFNEVRRRYFMALAREKYNLYASISLINGN